MSKYPYIGKLLSSEDRFSIALLLGDGKGVLLENTIDDKDTLTYTDEFCDWVFTDITADYLRNTKVKVESHEHRCFIIGFANKHADRTLNKDGYLYLMNGNTGIEHSKEINLPMPPKEEEMKNQVYGAAEAQESAVKASRAIDALKEIGCDYIDGKWMIRPKEAPIYTKEMHDRGELPPVGSEVMTSHGKAVVKLPPDKAGFMIAEANGVYQTLTIGNVRPLPTSADKLRDELVRSMDNSNTAFTYADHIAKAIINGDIDVSKYVKGESND